MTKQQFCVALLYYEGDSTPAVAEMLIRMGINFKLAIYSVSPSFEYTHIIVPDSPDFDDVAQTDVIPQWIYDSTCPVLTIGNSTKSAIKHFGGITFSKERKTEMVLVNHDVPTIGSDCVDYALYKESMPDYFHIVHEFLDRVLTMHDGLWLCTSLSIEKDRDYRFLEMFIS